MKKILFVGLALIGFSTANAQEESAKKFRFGLKGTPSISWLKIDDEKAYDKGGASIKFGYGLMTEFKITDVAWFSTGLQIDYDGGKWKSKTDSISYYINKDNEFLESELIKLDATAGPGDLMDDSLSTQAKGYTPYGLKSRSYRSMYLTIPLALRLKTKEIGYLTYYGGFGFLTSIHIRTKADDEVQSYVTGTPSSLEKVDISKDMNFIRFGLTLSGGVEINLSGSTSVLLGLSFNQFFLNNVKKNSKYNIDVDKTTTSTNTGTVPVEQAQKFLGRNIGLTVGLLF